MAQQATMTSLMQQALALKKLRAKAKNHLTLSTEPSDGESDEEETRKSFESFGDDTGRSGWPQPARFPTERERRTLTTCTDDWVTEHVPDLNGNESCSSSESDSECDFAESSDYDAWNAADSNVPGFKTPLPRSVTIRDLPDWRARMLLDSRSSSAKEDTLSKKRQLISDATGARLVFGLGCTSQGCSLLSSSSSGNSSSEVGKHEKNIPGSRTLSRVPEPSNFLGRSACQRLRALCAASSSLNDEDDEEASGFACDTGLAASSSDQESDESDDEACRPQRTKARSDFPDPSEYLSPKAYRRPRALCGASPLAEHDAAAARYAALLPSDELSEWNDKKYLPQRTQARSDFPPPEEYLKPALLAKLMRAMR